MKQNVKYFLLFNIVAIITLSFVICSKLKSRNYEFLVQLDDSFVNVVKLGSIRFGFIFKHKVVSNIYLFELDPTLIENAQHISVEEFVEDFRGAFKTQITHIEPRLTSFVKYRFVQRNTSPKVELLHQIGKRYARQSPSCWPYYDMGVENVWNMGINGSGVRVAVVDNGVNTDHPDIHNRIDFYLSRSFVDVNSSDISAQRFYNYLPETDEITSHGTMVTGLIAGEFGNDYCSAGIAFGSQIVVLKVFSTHDRVPSWIQNGFAYSDEKLSAGLDYERNNIDIYSCSFNRDREFVALPLDIRKALRDGIEKGRNGKGSIFVFSAGNYGGSERDCNVEGFANSAYTVTIGSVGEKGAVPSYALNCASTLAATFGEYKLYKGSKKLETTSHTDDCTNFVGTSASAALGSGIYALLLQANPELTWRDVQHITVRSSSLVNLTSSGDIRTNAAGFSYSHYFGFGLMNAYDMVLLAKAWTTVPALVNCSVHANDLTYIDNTTNDAAAIILRFDACKPDENCVQVLEQVLVILSYSTKTENFGITLISPNRSKSNLLRNTLSTRSRNTKAISEVIHRTWTLKTVHFWGENPHGTWIILIRGNNAIKKKRFQLFNATITFYGTTVYPYENNFYANDDHKINGDKKPEENFIFELLKNYQYHGPNVNDVLDVVEETTKNPTNYWAGIMSSLFETTFILTACRRYIFGVIQKILGKQTDKGNQESHVKSQRTSKVSPENQQK